MTLNVCAVREWRCRVCGGECHVMNREIDGHDLLCGGCGRAYVIVAVDYAETAGS